jgi:hypothetical protein
MGLTAGSMAGMALVLMRFIRNVERQRRERSG